jgi:hypothetical protein
MAGQQVVLDGKVIGVFGERGTVVWSQDYVEEKERNEREET